MHLNPWIWGEGSRGVESGRNSDQLFPPNRLSVSLPAPAGLSVPICTARGRVNEVIQVESSDIRVKFRIPAVTSKVASEASASEFHTYLG